jgi:multisubunit Na+/H+ antiporter MnhF subunit
VNPWLGAAAALLVGLAACLAGTMRGPPTARLVAAELATTLCSAALLLLARGFGRSDYLDAAVFVALLSFPGGLMFARFLERWL